jgi:3-oxoacyl-[acyl-carrier protein] reductase
MLKILITGGASGLGKIITTKLSQLPDATIIITYCNSEQSARYIESNCKNVRALKCDFTSQPDIESLLLLIENEGIDILVNNAQITKIEKQHFHKLNPDIFLNGFQKNIIPVIRITQAAIKVFRTKKSGKIINVLTSFLANKPPVGVSEYTASKAYLLSLSKSWANENAAYNITSNSISPSFMKTGLTSDTDERVIYELESKHPLKRLLPPENVAETVMFLCTASVYINGVNLYINAAENLV